MLGRKTGSLGYRIRSNPAVVPGASKPMFTDYLRDLSLPFRAGLDSRPPSVDTLFRCKIHTYPDIMDSEALG